MRAVAPEWDAFVGDELARRAEQGLLRRLRPLDRRGGWVVTEDGRRLLNLSSNDYLGLARHPTVVEAAARAARRGAGATASRLIVGHDPACAALEEKLAAFKGTEAALVFSSGYAANLGALAALLDREAAVFSDRLNHASIWDGIRLSGAQLHRYGHRDVDHLARLLEEAERRRVRRKLIVTDTVFSMDGDVAPLAEIVELKERFGAALMVDEAHAEGVLGGHGEGYAHELGLGDRVDLHMGTFSKAFGSHGAHVAGRSSWIAYLTNRARSFVYTTALPPAVIGASDAALDLVRQADEERAGLRRRAERFRARLGELGLDVGDSATQIVPILVGEAEPALELSRALEESGVLAVAIRPPSVPPGTARLRFSLTADHSDTDLERVVEAVSEASHAVSGLVP